MMKWTYNLMYRYSLVPWDIGPRQELIDVIESGRVEPCRTVYLGSGTAKNAIYMAEMGFEVTAIDFAISAVELGRKRAQAAGVEITFVQDDLTNLRHISGKYDFLVDFGTFDDLNQKDRQLYLENVLPLTKPGSLFFLWCFEWPTRWWERFPFPMALEPGEVEELFGDYFNLERIAGSDGYDYSTYPRGVATYLMARKEEVMFIDKTETEAVNLKDSLEFQGEGDA
jgi:SAM-dependent methyltransferase